MAHAGSKIVTTVQRQGSLISQCVMSASHICVKFTPFSKFLTLKPQTLSSNCTLSVLSSMSYHCQQVVCSTCGNCFFCFGNAQCFLAGVSSAKEHLLKLLVSFFLLQAHSGRASDCWQSILRDWRMMKKIKGKKRSQQTLRQQNYRMSLRQAVMIRWTSWMIWRMSWIQTTTSAR